MEKVRSYFTKKRFRLVLPLLIYLAVYMAIFHFTEVHIFDHYFLLNTRVDDMIPFCEAFIIPYFSWFIYVPMGVAIALAGDEKTYRSLSSMLCIGMTVFLIVTIVFPNRLTLRPYVMPRNNVLTRMVRMLYAADTPTGVFPSMHVYNSICIMDWAYAVYPSDRRGRRIKWIYAIWGMLIILSTMFLKQHSILDVIAAMIMAVLVYPITYRDQVRQTQENYKLLES